MVQFILEARKQAGSGQQFSEAYPGRALYAAGNCSGCLLE